MSYNPNFQGTSAQASRKLLTGYVSGFGSILAKGTALSINAGGLLVPTDITDESSVFKMVGLAGEDIPTGASGQVVDAGRLENVSLSPLALGDPIYIAAAGGFTNNKPQVGVEGFVVGDFVVFVGLVVRNEFNAGLLDIKMSLTLVGQL